MEKKHLKRKKKIKSYCRTAAIHSVTSDRATVEGVYMFQLQISFPLKCFNCMTPWGESGLAKDFGP